MTRLPPLGALLWALVSLLLAAGLWAGLRAAPGLSPFAVREVRVQGTERTPPSTIVEAAHLTPDTTLFAVDVQAVQRRVEALPWVKRARIIRQLPWSLAVTVEEWVPAYLVRLDRLYYLTQEGHVVRAPVDQGLDYPVLTGLTWSDLESPGPARASLLATLACVARNVPVGEVSEIHADPADGYTVYAAGDSAQGIYLGAGALEEKFVRLARLRRQLERRGQTARTVNLAYDDKIIARVVNAAGEGGDR
ncbi:MAG: FtsQ-type POTRA domain-containing protein [Deltaproteobacteria bacterium]|nr:FtsQ-type POTRA domain-containing protein [Deltaproteobacteria bacterium]